MIICPNKINNGRANVCQFMPLSILTDKTCERCHSQWVDDQPPTLETLPTFIARIYTPQPIKTPIVEIKPKRARCEYLGAVLEQIPCNCWRKKLHKCQLLEKAVTPNDDCTSCTAYQPE